MLSATETLRQLADTLTEDEAACYLQMPRLLAALGDLMQDDVPPALNEVMASLPAFGVMRLLDMDGLRSFTDDCLAVALANIRKRH